MKTKKRIKIGIATTFVIVILMSLCGSRFVFQKACVRRETSWLNMGTADDYIYNLLVDAYNIRKEKNETVTIKASDGINLVGHYYERDKNAPLIASFGNVPAIRHFLQHSRRSSRWFGVLCDDEGKKASVKLAEIVIYWER